MPPDIEIDLLADHPEAVAVLTEWFEVEWAPYYGSQGQGSAERDLRESAQRDALPVAPVAFWSGTLCGTAALKPRSVTTHPQLTPWLAALLVIPEFRRKGVGAALIAAVEDDARRRGFQSLYCGTDSAESLLQHRGWEFLERTPYFAGDVSIYRKRLSQRDHRGSPFRLLHLPGDTR